MPKVLITAGHSNLGTALINTFFSHGYDVYITTTKERKPSPKIVKSYVCDLSKSTSFSFPDLGDLDVLVNNAGVFTESSLEDLKSLDFDKVFNLNVRGMFFLTKALIPSLKKTDGAIVNISSINAIHPGFGGTVHYDASKGAVNAFTRSLAAETGLRVNAVQPGQIWRKPLEGSELEAFWKDHSVKKALMDPMEIASAVYFLATSRGIYGECLTIDNGYTLC